MPTATGSTSDDAPQLTDEFFEKADKYRGGTLRGRPKADVWK
jgi:hypothetical protein